MTTRGHWVVFYDFMTLGDIILVSYVHDPWLNIYIYVHDAWWSLAVCVCVYVCVWFSNHETCCLNYNMFVVLTCPRLQVSVCVFGSAIMILVVWITACFLFWTAPTPPGFNLSMTTVCMCFVWFNNHDTCCLNYSMFFVLNCPHPSRFQFKHDYCVYVFCLVL